MAGAELVVRAFATLQEPGDPVGLAEAGKHVIAPGQELPGICLMPDIPHDFVGRRIELVEQRDAELDHAQTGPDMPTGDRAALDEAVANLLRQLRELVAAETLEILGRLDAGQERHGRRIRYLIPSEARDLVSGVRERAGKVPRSLRSLGMRSGRRQRVQPLL